MLTINRLADKLGQAACIVASPAVRTSDTIKMVCLGTFLENTLAICRVFRSQFAISPQVVYRFHNPAFGRAEWPVV